MEKSMEQFGDQMFVKHAPMVQQEGKDVKLFSKQRTLLTQY